MAMTYEYTQRILTSAVQEAFNHYLLSPHLAAVVLDAEEANEDQCTCANRSWYGPDHDSACPSTDGVEAAVIADFAKFLSEQYSQDGK
jgi:hypothetical protein